MSEDGDAGLGWLGVKRASKPGPETPNPGRLFDQHGRPVPPPRNPYVPGSYLHAWREFGLAVDDLATEMRRAVERVAYRVARTIRRER